MSGTLPLFEKYPALSGLPHVRLGLFPTPVQELHGLSESDNRVFIKRDDLSGLEYGGNKVRKLEFALGEAKANGCTDVITFGCDGSNHALATGIYAGKLGMHSISILRTQHNTRYLRKNLLKSAFYGIELHHCETKQEMDALTDTLVAERLAEGKKAPYIVPVGGSSPLGTVGFVNAAFELAGQIAAGQLPEPDYIYAADGTNGTVAGLMIGLKALGLKPQVIPVRVNDEAASTSPPSPSSSMTPWRCCADTIRPSPPCTFPRRTFLSSMTSSAATTRSSPRKVWQRSDA